MILSAPEAYRHWASSYDDTLNPMVSLIDRNLIFGDTRGKLVIDVGCGTGRIARNLDAVGVDLSFEMIARGKGRLVQAHALQLPFAAETANLVLCILTAGYLPSVRELMEELRRVTRRGGLIQAADVHPQAILAGWKRAFRDGENHYEIENHPYCFDDLAIEGLVLQDAQDLYFGEPERDIYARAGRPELFEKTREIPAAWIRKWIRR